MEGRIPKKLRGHSDLGKLIFSDKKCLKSFKQTGTGPNRRHIQGSKIAKRLPSVKVFSSTVHKKPKIWTELVRQGDPLRFFIHSVAKLFLFSGKNLTMPKKTQRRNLLGFSNIHSVAKHQKMQGGPFGKFFFEKKSRSAEKNERGEPLVSPGMVCYAEKQEKPFWFSSLGQIVQFGAIIFCRTFKNYFGQFVWIEKKESL